MTKTGRLLPDKESNDNLKTQLLNRVLRFRNDEYDRFGIMILTDEKQGLPPGSEYMTVEGCRLFTFPFTPIVDSRCSLSTIKEGRIIELMTSD